MVFLNGEHAEGGGEYWSTLYGDGLIRNVMSVCQSELNVKSSNGTVTERVYTFIVWSLEQIVTS